MRETTYHLYLDETEYSRVIESLISLKNSLIRQGRYTDAVYALLLIVGATSLLFLPNISTLNLKEERKKQN